MRGITGQSDRRNWHSRCSPVKSGASIFGANGDADEARNSARVLLLQTGSVLLQGRLLLRLLRQEMMR